MRDVAQGSESDTRGFVWGIAPNVMLVVVSAILTWLAFPPCEFWWIAWVCLVPLFVVLRLTSVVRASGWMALAFGVLFLCIALPWMFRIFGPGTLGMAILGSLPWILFGLTYRLLCVRARSLAIVAMAPVLWVAAEWLRCEGWYFEFSWVQLGFSQVVWSGGLSLYPVVGVYGVTFLIVLVNAALVEALYAPRKRRSWVIPIVGAVLVGGLWACSRPQNAPTSVGKASVVARVVQIETGELEKLEQLSLRKAAGNLGLIVWPEYAVNGYPMSIPVLLGRLQNIARVANGVLVVGCKERAPSNAGCDWLRRRAMGKEPFYNTALVISPDGKVLGRYHKTHPIQLFSDGIPGVSYPVFDTPAGRIGIAICYDFDFASAPLNLVRNGAELLVVPAFDSMEWTELQHVQHSRMAQARAAEVGRWVVRAASSGISQIINPCGVAVVSLPYSAIGAADGRVGLLTRWNPYTRGLYVLPKLCILASVLWLAQWVWVGLAGKHKLRTQ